MSLSVESFSAQTHSHHSSHPNNSHHGHHPHNQNNHNLEPETLARLSTAGQLRELSKALKSEKYSPVLRPFHASLIALVCTLLKKQGDRVKQGVLASSSTVVGGGSAVNSAAIVPQFVRELQLLELDRIRYLLAAYFRTRLNKIERNLFYIYRHNLAALLSESEFQFAERLLKAYLKAMHEAFLCPKKFAFWDTILKRELKPVEPNKKDSSLKDLSAFGDKDGQGIFSLGIVSEPNEERYVFVRFDVKTENINFGIPGENYDVHEGTVVFVQYMYIRKLHERGFVTFI